jgi:hypothetical protein
LLIAGLIAAIAAMGSMPPATAQSAYRSSAYWWLRYHPAVPQAVFRYRLAPLTLVSDVQACRAALERYPGGVCLKIRRTLPSGDFLVTVRLKNKVRRIRVDGRTGACLY